MPIISTQGHDFDFFDPLGRPDALLNIGLGQFENPGVRHNPPANLNAQLLTAAPVLGSSGIGSLAGLLGTDNEQLDQLGPLFRTLLTLQGGRGNGQSDFFNLFSGIQL